MILTHSLAVAASLIGLRTAAQPAYFIDGYHGGIYGHIPSWQTRFMVEKLKQYPNWKINLEIEPESWDSIALSDPTAYADFQRMFADQSSKGRIEYVNPSYGQSYLFNISGESIIQQFHYGIRTLRRHFPTAVFSTYSSEEPCFTSALPQILRSYGFKYASLKNPNTCWGGYTRAFGGELVNWVGPDGTGILTSPRYEVEALKPGSTWETIAANNGEAYIKAAFAYGIKHPVGMCLQDAGWAYGPWLRGGNYTPTVYETWRGYFEDVAHNRSQRPAGRTDGQAIPDWRFSQEDILVGLMWGAQVLQRIAQEVRRSENAIIQAEKMAAMARIWQGMPWPGALLDQGWRTLLLSQHHDCWIVPYNGKPGNTWADKVVKWTGVTNRNSDSIIRESTQLLTEHGGTSFIRVFNTTAISREEYVHVGDALYKVKVPPMGYTTCSAADTASAVTSRAIVIRSGRYVQVETDLYRIMIDTARGGVITSWIARKLGNKEFVKSDSAFNELRGNFYNAGGMRSNTEKPARVSIQENGPAEIKIRIAGAIADNSFTEVLTLQMGQPRVDIHLRIDWKGSPAIGEYFEVPKDDQVRKAYYDDRYKLLALFPLKLDSQKVYKNAPFDVMESRLDNTFYRRWDSIKNNVLLDWVDVTDGPGNYGMTLFSDHTTSYAHGRDFPLGLTVQYSGNGIFYRNYTLDGASELNYALLPHAGRWDRAGIWTEGTKWREPLIACPMSDRGEGFTGRNIGPPTGRNAGSDSSGTRSLLIPDAGVEVSSLQIEGNALVVRLFNAEAASPLIRVYLGFAATAVTEVELDGREIRTLPVQKDKSGRRWIELRLPRFGIRTIKFDHV
jgi:alpha-mannosidase